MAFFTFSQNNSGGSFLGPAKYVIVEADSAMEANNIAIENGIYFNGCETGCDCPCCGDRWHPVSQCEECDTPEIYGTPAEQYYERYLFKRESNIPQLLIVRK